VGELTLEKPFGDRSSPAKAGTTAGTEELTKVYPTHKVLIKQF